MGHASPEPGPSRFDIKYEQAKILSQLGDHKKATEALRFVLSYLKSDSYEVKTQLEYWGGTKVTVAMAEDSLNTERKHIADDEQAEREKRAKITEQERQQAAEGEARAEDAKTQKVELAHKRQAKLEALLKRHKAAQVTLDKVESFVANPFVYVGKNVLLPLVYLKNIGRSEAILQVYPFKDIVQLDTRHNLADSQGAMIRCIGKVLGTVMVLQGGTRREIPHLRELACVQND